MAYGGDRSGNAGLDNVMSVTLPAPEKHCS